MAGVADSKDVAAGHANIMELNHALHQSMLVVRLRREGMALKQALWSVAGPASAYL